MLTNGTKTSNSAMSNASSSEGLNITGAGTGPDRPASWVGCLYGGAAVLVSQFHSKNKKTNSYAGPLFPAPSYFTSAEVVSQQTAM